MPEVADLTDEQWQECSRIIAHAIAERPPALRRQLALFIRLLDLISFARHGKPLHRLPLPQRTALLERIQDSRLLLLRRGLWGVRTLVLMGYYTRPAAAAAIGYHAQPDGWTARR